MLVTGNYDNITITITTNYYYTTYYYYYYDILLLRHIAITTYYYTTTINMHWVGCMLGVGRWALGRWGVGALGRWGAGALGRWGAGSNNGRLCSTQVPKVVLCENTLNLVRRVGYKFAEWASNC